MMFAANQIGPCSKRTAVVALVLVVGLLGACKKNTTSVGTKAMWIANGTNVLEYIPKQLGTGTSAAVPHLMINSGAFGAPQGVTFDAKGNLWVMDPQAMINGKETPALLEFSAAQLAALPTTNGPEPVAVITSTSLAFPQQSVFDAAGNQWVTDHNKNTVVVFNPTQMAMTGVNVLVPVVTISSATFNGPLGIAFDAAGDLWVANNGGVPITATTNSVAGTTIEEFTAAHLPVPPATGMLTPTLAADVTLSDVGGVTIQAPWALTFDTAGNLWSSNANAPNTLVRFAKANLAATGAPTPMVTLSPLTIMGNPTLNAPNGVCINDAGDVAAMNSAPTTPGSNPLIFSLAFFGNNQLATGMPTPNTFIVGAATTLNAPAGCVFGTLVN